MRDQTWPGDGPVWGVAGVVARGQAWAGGWTLDNLLLSSGNLNYLTAVR